MRYPHGPTCRPSATSSSARTATCWSRRSSASRASAATSRSSTTCTRPAACRSRGVHADRARGVGAGDARAPAHRHARAVRGGDPVLGRQVLQYNNDVEIGDLPARHRGEYFYRDGEGDEVIFVHEGEGVVRDDLRRAAVPPARLHRDPARHDVTVPVRHAAALADLLHAGRDRDLNRYRNRYGQLLEHAPFSQRDFHPPAELRTHREARDVDLKVRVRGGYQDYVLDYHPFDVVGWDGYVYPTRSTSRTSSPRPGGCISRRPRTRRSRARTS